MIAPLVGRAILPAAGFQPALAASKGGCGQDWPPHKSKLANPNLLEAYRYFAGPPLSADDLKTLSEGVLSPARLRTDPDRVRRIVDIVRMGLDRRRFPWISESREPTPEQRAAAVLASAALMAARSVGTARRHEGKEAQELMAATQACEESIPGRYRR